MIWNGGFPIAIAIQCHIWHRKAAPFGPAIPEGAEHLTTLLRCGSFPAICHGGTQQLGISQGRTATLGTRNRWDGGMYILETPRCFLIVFLNIIKCFFFDSVFLRPQGPHWDVAWSFIIHYISSDKTYHIMPMILRPWSVGCFHGTSSGYVPCQGPNPSAQRPPIPPQGKIGRNQVWQPIVKAGWSSGSLYTC